MGGFSAISRAYKADPTIANYVALRRQQPDEVIEVAVNGGLEWLFDNRETLKTFGISPNLVASVLDADPSAISELSLQLLELIIARQALEKSDKTQVVSRKLAISDSLVNFLINLMLDSMEWNNDLFIPRDLVVLIRHQTGGGVSDWDKAEELKEHRWKVFMAIMELVAQGKAPTMRIIAGKLGVNATTVMRWYPEGELAKRLEEVAALTKRLVKK